MTIIMWLCLAACAVPIAGLAFLVLVLMPWSEKR